MSARATGLLARRSIRSHIGRTLAIALAIAVSVSFVVGSFVLADSLRTSISRMFDELYANTDLQVRTEQPFESDAIGPQIPREPMELELVDRVAEVDGVELAVPSVERYAQIIRTDDDGEEEALGTQGPPTLGVSWAEGDDILAGVNFREGVAPDGPGEFALDTATAKRAEAEVGDEVRVTTDTGTDSYTLTGTFSLLDTEGFSGATVALWDLDTAMEVLGTDGRIDTINIAVADDADVEEVQRTISQVLPDGVEVLTGQEVADEDADQVNEIIDLFGNGLLIFAFVTAFVGAFIINNVFAITIGQRLRELALLRAIGAGGRQVRRMITAEAIGLSVLATAAGIALGIGVARLLIALFNAAGAGFPETGTVLLPRTVLLAFLVGVGVTLASVRVPARRAARVPPVAAMRPEMGYSSLRAGRLILGASVTVVGIVLFLVGLFVRPGGNVGLGVLGGGGGLMIFLGVAGLSSTIARPAVRIIGAPIARFFGTAGQLARDNAGRSPRRTSSSAAALMISVALVSAAAIFATSLRDTVGRILDRAVQADYLVSNEAGTLPPTIAATMRDMPELDAVSPFRGTIAEIADSTRSVVAGDPAAVEELVNLDVQDGSLRDLGDDDVFVHDDRADRLDLEVGDTIDATFISGETRTLQVAGIFGDNSLMQTDWFVSLDTLAGVTETAPQDFFVIATVADGVDLSDAGEAIRTALADFPQATVETAGEYLQSVEEQIDQLLFIITGLLVFAIAIAVLGISITLALGVLERTREIGLLRAVGMNRRQTRRTVRWEAVIVSLFGALVGILVGSLLGVALSLAVPDTIVETVSFSPQIIVTIVVGAVIAGFVAALYPAAKASRMDVLDAITTE